MSSNIRIKKTCLYCNKEFIAQRTTTKYCSHKCNQRHYKELQRNKKIEKVNSSENEIKIKNLDVLKNKDFLSISEISQLFGVSRTTIWRLCKYDKLKSVKIGKSRFISRKQLEFLFSTDDELETIQPYAKEVVYKEEDYYSVLEIQEKYNMSQSAVYNLVKRNNLSKITIWKNIFIPKTEIEAVFS